jgi:hypothetical protein
MPQISTVSASEVPKRVVQGRGKPESPAMTELRTQIRRLPHNPGAVVKLELEPWENEKTVYQQIRNAALKEEIPVRTEWHKETRTYYVYWGLVAQTAAEEPVSSKGKSKKASERESAQAEVDQAQQ